MISQTAHKSFIRKDDAAVQYPPPGRGCLRQCLAPGHAAAASANSGDSAFSLVVETVNTTGWSSLKRRLMATDAHVLLAQETWVNQAAAAGASSWARRNGWRSIWSPAATTKRGGTAGGVAILARDFLGLHLPPNEAHEIVPARAVMGVLEAPGQRALRVVSCYLKHGIKATEENASTLARIGEVIEGCGDDEPCIVGGDFNMSPHDLLATEIDRRVSATVFYPDGERGTFRTAKACSTIDFLLISDRIAAAVEEVRMVEGTGVKCHVPVQVAFKPRMAQLRALHVRQPPKLATQRVYGPLPPPLDWRTPTEMAQAALEAARADAPDLTTWLEKAYAVWADKAEEELEAFTGTQLPKGGERAKRPRLVWRSVMPEKRRQETFPERAALVWLRGIVAEVQRITSVFDEGDAAGRHGDQVREDGDEDAALPNGDGGTDDDDTPCGYLHADDDYDLHAHGEPGGEELDGGRAETWERRARGPPMARDHCLRVLEDIAESLVKDTPRGSPTDSFSAVIEEVTALVDSIRGATDEPWTHGQPAQWRGRADALRLGLDEIVARVEKKEDGEEASRWRKWIQEDFAAGARRAHAYTRLPMEATPTAVKTQGGALSSKPEALLGGQRDKFRAHWKPAAGAYQYKWPTRDELHMLTPDHLRETARSFPWKTACTYDGFHPRQIADLPDEALAALAILLQAVEVSGQWPPQVSLVMTPLLPKPKGGFRPIGLMAGIYRVWAKARRAAADEWEAAHQRAYLSSSRGNGSIETMWRMATRQEAGVSEGEQAGIVADDLAAFFETIDREALMREAVAMGYPLPILRAALGAYSAARMLTLQGRVCRELYPTVGVVAGCSLAMSLTKLFYVRAFDAYVKTLPPAVHLDVHVDDVTLSAVGPARQVPTLLASARGALATVIQDLGCTFAAEKTAITGTTREITDEIARRIGVAGDRGASACLLGVDCTAGAPRRRLARKSRRAERLRAALARKVRLRKLRAIVGQGAVRIFRAGVLPAATYDASIWGLSDAECLRVRRVAATAMSPRAKGRSLSMVHLWNGVPTADAENAPIIMYARMIWKAVTRRDEAIMRASSLADIRARWEAAQPAFGPLAQAMLEARRHDGTIPPAVARRTWSLVRGPLAAAAVSLARRGWRFTSPFTVCDATDTEHTLTTTSPSLLRDLLRDALRDDLERRVGASFAKADEGFRDRRACLDFATRYARAGKRCSAHQAAVFRAVACGAIWTGSVARARGYDTDGLCALCHAAPDTVHHRTYCCEATRHSVQAAVPSWFWDEARRSSAHDAFWTTAVVPHPAEEAPPPRADLLCEVEHLTREGKENSTVDNLRDIGGRVYVDGSCQPSTVRGLARAAMALVTADDAGAHTKVLQLPVPRHLPQTAQAAETLVMAVAHDSARGALEVIGDCLNVIRAYQQTAARALLPGRKYAGVVLDSFKDLARRRLISTRWTRAHREETSAKDEGEARDIRGNKAADEAAKEAIGLHPPIGDEVTRKVDFYEKRAPHIVAAVTAAMGMFPRAPTDLGRVPRPRTAEEAERTERHLWSFRAGAWRCQRCDDYITARRMPPYRRHQRCTGKGFAESASSFAAHGHVIIRVEADLPVIMCSKCGSWGNRRTRGLAQPCGEPTKAGRQALVRVAKGLHPLVKYDGRCGTGLKARASVTAAYDASSGTWRPTDAGARARDTSDAPVGAAASSSNVHLAPPVAPHEESYHADIGADTYLPNDGEGGASSEEDVFGHGGQLSQEPQAHAAEAVESAAAAARDDVNARGTADVDGGGMRSARSVRRDMVCHAAGGRDFVAEAVERLGSSLRRGDADPRGRMERLRRRIGARTRAHTAEEEEPTGCGTKRPRGGDAERELLRLDPPQPGGPPLPDAAGGQCDGHPRPGDHEVRDHPRSRGSHGGEVSTVQPQREGGGTGANPRELPPQGGPRVSPNLDLSCVRGSRQVGVTPEGPSLGIGGHASPMAGPPRRRRRSPSTSSATGRHDRRPGAWGRRRRRTLAPAEGSDAERSNGEGIPADHGDNARSPRALRGEARRGPLPPPATRAELLAMLRAHNGSSTPTGEDPGDKGYAAGPVGELEEVDRQGKGGAGSQEETVHGGTAQGSDRYQEPVGPRRRPRRGAKRGPLGSLHDEFGRAKVARSVAGDAGRGSHPQQRSGDITRCGGGGCNQGVGTSDDGASGGGTSGTTATEATTPSAVPRFATAAAVAQCSRVVEVASGAVPARRRIVGKRRDPLLAQVETACAVEPTLEVASSAIREPRSPGHRAGLTGRPPD